MLRVVNSFFSRVVTCCLLATTAPLFQTNTFAQESIFEDVNLERAARQEVFAKRYSDEPITAEDAAKISQIVGQGFEIKSLAGIEHCKQLRLIQLADNAIEDITPIASLNKLQSIDLSGNQLSDVAPLQELVKLQYLNLSGNSIDSIAALERLTGLRSLYLSQNKIQEIEVIQNMPKLWSLYLDENPVADASPIQSLKYLNDLSLRDCSLRSVDFIEPLTDLRYLNLSQNQIQDASRMVQCLKADRESGLLRFSPYLKLDLTENPLDADSVKELQRLQENGVKIQLSDD